MKHSLSNLPGEILTVIFNLVRLSSGVRSLCQCELVCKKWKQPAQRSLYLRVELYSAHQVDTIIDVLNHNLSSCPGRFTRTLEYHAISEANDSQLAHWMDSFVNIFPQVQYVFPFKPDTKFYSALIAANNAGKWKNLKYFGTCPDESLDVHSTCALLYRETLDILNVHDGQRAKSENNLYNKLHLFSCLKQLYLETNQHSLFESVEHVTKNIQALKALSYGNLTGTDFNALAPFKSVDISSIIPQPSIKRLEMHTIGFENDNYLLYLMKKFPELDSITINPNIIPIIRHKQLFDKIKSSINNHSLPILAKFMAYISKCQSYTVKLLYTNLKAGKLLKSYWKLCGGKEPRILGVSYIDTTNWNNLEPQIVPDNEQVYINMTYNPQQGERITSLNYQSRSTGLPHLEMLEECGTEIDELVFCLDPFKSANVISGQDRDMTLMANGYFFSHILKFCTKLQKLYICNSNIKSFTSHRHFYISTSITDLTLENILISKDVVSQIPKYLPCLKRLALVDLYSSGEETQDKKANFDSVIDIRESSLRFFYLKNYFLGTACENSLSCKILLKVTTEEGDLYYRHIPNIPVDVMTNNISQNTEGLYSSGPKHVVSVQLEEDILACPIDEDEYNAGLYDENRANIHIICKAVNYIAVSLEKINPLLSCVIMLIDLKTYIRMAGMNTEQKLDILMKNIH